LLGLHALQVLPVVGYLGSAWDRLSERQAVVGPGLIALLYAGLTLFAFVQTLRGIPVVSSVPTLSVATGSGPAVPSVAPSRVLPIPPPA